MSGIFDQIINYSPPLIVSGTVNYKGTWNASTNNPTLNSSPAASTKGDYYVVSTAGTQFGITFAIGDWIISNGTAWEKVDLTDAVSSVFGRTGAVVGVSTDYSAVGLTNTAIGASNPSTGAFTTVTASSTIAATGAVTGSNLSGTNTGDQTTITGNAGTATALQTARTIGGSSFDGTANVTSFPVPGAIGVTTPAAANFTSIGVTTQGTGAFTTLSATGTISQTPNAGDPTYKLELVTAYNGADSFRLKVAGTTYLRVNTNDGVLLAPSGLAVTGALSSTTGFSTTGNSTFTEPTLGTTSCYLGMSTTGAYFGTAAAKPVYFETNGTERLRIDSSGNVGIGTTSPLVKFSVIGVNGAESGTATPNGSISIGETGSNNQLLTLGVLNGSGNHSWIQSRNSSTTSTYALALNPSGGNVGIGTSSPSAKLEVYSTRTSATSVDALLLNDNVTGAQTNGVGKFIASYSNAGSSVSKIGFLETDGTNNNTSIAFYTSPSAGGLAERMRINNTGNVGIGTTSPASKLQVTTSGAAALPPTSGTTPSTGELIRLRTSSDGAGGIGTIGLSTNQMWLQACDATNLGAYYNLLLNPNGGGVGIGTSSPAQRLHVDTGVTSTNQGVPATSGTTQNGIFRLTPGNVTYGECLDIGMNVSPTYAWIQPTNRADLSLEYNLALNPNGGNVLVGLTGTSSYMDGAVTVSAALNSPAVCAKLNPSSSAVTQLVYSAWAPFNSGDNNFLVLLTESSPTQRGGISYNRAAGLVVYATTSDYRSKDILGPVVDSGALIDSVPVYMGKMKGATQERPMFIAHETPAYAHTGEKDAVDAEGNPVYQQIDNSTLIPVLWAEIQSLRQRVAALESN